MKTSDNKTKNLKISHSSDTIAAISSIIPGLGHVYKAHYATGLGLLLVSPFVIWAGLMLGWATFGIGLFVPLAYLIFIGWHAYSVEDRRSHPGGFL